MNINQLPLQAPLLRAIHELGFTEATEIQEKCIPEVLRGVDLFAQSRTGSGKTAAFGLPILNNMTAGKGIQALILTPTRELCVQVTDALIDFSRYLSLSIVSVYGGVGIGPQITALKRADIVVGTPGRILDHLERKTIFFDSLRFLVLDEADKMFEMGFLEDVERILRHIPKERQTMLFSATLPESVMHLVRKHLRTPISVKTQVYVDPSLLRQYYYDIDARDKFSLLMHLLRNHSKGLSLVFCATRKRVDLVASNLHAQGVHALAIHGGLSQKKRLDALDALRHEQIQVLVATDVAARGLDIKNVDHVYNYDVPKSSEEYIHRIGRTARAGAQGNAVTLLCHEDYDRFSSVLKDRTLLIEKTQVPQFDIVKFIFQQQRSRRPFSRGGDRSFRGGGERRSSRGDSRPSRFQGRRR